MFSFENDCVYKKTMLISHIFEDFFSKILKKKSKNSDFSKQVMLESVYKDKEFIEMRYKLQLTIEEMYKVLRKKYQHFKPLGC